MTDVPPIEESWERLEAWLAAHAPASSARLNPPASPDAIDDAQRQMAIALPTDLVSSLLRHNGASEFDANGPSNGVRGSCPAATGCWRCRRS